jgi:iron(III) transport system substrate-binding protein
MRKVVYSCFAVFAALVVTSQADAAEQKTLEAAKAEGKVVVSIPPNADLRKKLEQAFEKRYPGIDLETVSSRGSKAVRRIADEARSKVPYFDVHVGGTSSMLSGLVAPGLVQPFAPLMERPDVRDPSQWWGGHIYVDGANKFAYSFMGYLSENLYYNSNEVDPKEIVSYNDLLNPKWEGRIGFFDPRTPGPGDSTWTYLWEVMGDAYLRKLVQQKLLISRNRRQLAESLIKGKLAITIGMSYYSLSRFVKEGLPLKALPIPKEGTYPTGGTGAIVVLKDNPHPNATRVFVNWLLSKEGQEIFARTMGHVSRRFDVDSSWAKDLGILGAKDVMSVSEYHKYENQSEQKIAEVRIPAGKLARELLK